MAPPLHCETVTIMRRSVTQPFEAGFSLIELITVTAIPGLVVAVSTPGFVSFYSWSSSFSVRPVLFKKIDV